MNKLITYNLIKEELYRSLYLHVHVGPVLATGSGIDQRYHIEIMRELSITTQRCEQYTCHDGLMNDLHG